MARTYINDDHVQVHHPKNDLVIVVTPKTVNKLRTLIENFKHLGYLELERRFFAQYLPDYEFSTVNQLGAMSEAPYLEFGEKIWWYPGYTIKSPLNDLLDSQYTTFTFVK